MLAAMKLHAIFEFNIDDPTSIIDQEIIGDVVAGDKKTYAISVRLLKRQDCPVVLKHDQFLRVSIITAKGREKIFEDLNSDGLFDVRRELLDGKATRLDLLHEGDWIGVGADAWGGAEGCGPLIRIGS